MSAASLMAAEILELSAAGFAAAANAERERLAGGARADSLLWRAHLEQRVLELAAALRVGEPSLFARRIAWLRRAAAARRSDDAEILLALKSLQAALRKELPGTLKDRVGEVVELALGEAELPLERYAGALDAATRSGKLGLDFIAACLDRAAGDPIELILAAADDGMTPEQIYCEVLLRVEKEVGQLWHVGDFSVAEERLVSETTKRVMSLLAARFRPATTNGRTVLAASVAGNAHDIGLRIVSDLFALAGWHCLFLGANVPTIEISSMVEDYNVDLVVLTATLTPQLNALAEAIDAIHRVSPNARVLVGGIAFEGSDMVWQRIGADGFAARIDEAVTIGERLLGEPLVGG